MKTSLLNQLSKEITRGEWESAGSAPFVIDATSKIIADCVNEKTTRQEQLANVHAISLTPQLIREVLELRESTSNLLQIIESEIGYRTDSEYEHERRYAETVIKARSLLTRHETTN